MLILGKIKLTKAILSSIGLTALSPEWEEREIALIRVLEHHTQGNDPSHIKQTFMFSYFCFIGFSKYQIPIHALYGPLCSQVFLAYESINTCHVWAFTCSNLQ